MADPISLRHPAAFSKSRNLFSMAFSDRKREELFLCQHNGHTANSLRWASIVCAAIMAGFIWQDARISELGYIATNIRVFGVMPVCFMAWYASRKLALRRFIHCISAIFWLSFASLTAAILLVYEPGPFSLVGTVGVSSFLLILCGIFTFSSLRFWASLLVGMLTLLIYYVAVACWTNAIAEFVNRDLLTAMALVVGGATVSLFDERARRRQFEMSEQLQNSYLMVEQQVHERTLELQRTNIQLYEEISVRKGIENKLQASEHRFRMYFEKSADAIVIVNSKTYCLEAANLAALVMLKCSADEIIGINLAVLSSDMQPDGRSSQERYAEIVNLVKQQGFHRFEWHCQSPHRAPFPIEVAMTLIDDGLSPFILATWRDVSDRKLMEQQLYQSQKMESIGRLAGGVAHDFNNKLTIMLGYVQLAAEELPDTKNIEVYLDEVRLAAEYSRDITAQLLAFSRQQIVSPCIVDINSIINGTHKSLSRLIGDDIDLRFVPGENLWKIKIDPVQIDQIIMNLAVNSMDAMPDGGVLTIETTNSLLGEDIASHLPLSQCDYVLIKVSDNGIGIDSESIKHIFEPFFTTKDVGKGTGLGLATVHGIVLQNNGCIDVASQPGTGTTFHIYLPRDPECH